MQLDVLTDVARAALAGLGGDVDRTCEAVEMLLLIRRRGIPTATAAAAPTAAGAALALIRDRVAFNSEFLFTEESAALRQHPRFGEVIRGIRLDEYWDYHGWPAMCERSGTDIVCL